MDCADPSGAVPGRYSSDWDRRQFVQQMTVTLRNLCEFLNTFDSSVTDQLTALSARVSTIQRQIDHLESAFHGVSWPPSHALRSEERVSKESKGVCATLAGKTPGLVLRLCL